MPDILSREHYWPIFKSRSRSAAKIDEYCKFYTRLTEFQSFSITKLRFNYLFFKKLLAIAEGKGNDFLNLWAGIFFRNLSVKFWIKKRYKDGARPSRAVIHMMSYAVTYGTDHAGLWVWPTSAIANGSRLSHQEMAGCPLTDSSGVCWLLRYHGFCDSSYGLQISFVSPLMAYNAPVSKSLLVAYNAFVSYCGLHAPGFMSSPVAYPCL